MSAEIVVWYCLLHAWNFSWLLDRQSKAWRFSLCKESLIVPAEWKGEALASLVPQCLPSGDRDSDIDIRSLSLRQNQQGLLVPWLLCWGSNGTFLLDTGPSTCCKYKGERTPPPTLRILYSCLEWHASANTEWSLLWWGHHRVLWDLI